MANYHDGYLNQGAPVGAQNYDLTLIADNTVVDVTQCSLLRLYSDSATATARTFTLTAPAAGLAELVILFMSGSSYSCELLSSGNAKLQSTWTPVQYESIVLQWDGTYWVELGRKKQSLANLSDFLITSATNNNILYYKSADSAWENVAMSGDVTNSAGAMTIAASAVTLAKMANLAAKSVLVGPAATGAPVAMLTGAGSGSRITARQLTATFTVTIASPGVFTATSHGMVVGDAVFLTTTGAMPTGLSANTTYFVQNVADANTFQLSLTQGGAAINTTGTQSGVHTFNAGGMFPTALSIFNGDIAAAAVIDFSKLAALTSGNILVGSSGNVATSVAASGDATISNTGVISLDPSISVVTAVVSLTQSQITGLSVTPVQLVAGQASKLIVVDTVEFLHTYSTAVYANGGDVQVLYHGSTVICLADEDVVNGASSANYFYKPNFYDLGVTADPALNAMTALAGLAVDLSNATAPFINGNASNIIKVKVRYRVITLMT